MLIDTYLELYYIYVLYDIIYLLQSVPPSGSVFFLNKRIEYQKTVVRLAYKWCQKWDSTTEALRGADKEWRQQEKTE